MKTSGTTHEIVVCGVPFETEHEKEALRQLKDIGVISGHDSTVEAAVTKLMYLQARYNDPNTIRNLMARSIAGEITI